MKTLYLIRHADSDWKKGVQTDFDRPLNKNGQQDALTMGKQLKQREIAFEYILASSANRVKQTIDLIRQNINIPLKNVHFDESLYLASVENLTTKLNEVKNSYNTIALVGHNPGITALSNYLTEDYIDNMTTCGVVKIELEIDHWNEIVRSCGSRKYYLYPACFY